MSSLELIIGPMFSGKTTLLINKYNDIKKEFSTNDILIINHLVDSNRYKENYIVSHNKIEIPAMSFSNLSQIDNYLNNNHTVKYILINEGQFFENLSKWVINILDTTKINLIICGLDSDFKRDKFGTLLELIPHADIINKVKGKCNYCSNSSIYTHRLIQDSRQVVVGINEYIPLCRECYNKLNL